VSYWYVSEIGRARAEKPSRTRSGAGTEPPLLIHENVEALHAHLSDRNEVGGAGCRSSWAALASALFLSAGAGRLDLNGDDMLRAASVAATEAVRESLAPREIEQDFLRGVLVKEADAMAFMK
jgi:hypothetical protein